MNLYFDIGLPWIGYVNLCCNTDDFAEDYYDSKECVPMGMIIISVQPVATTEFVDATHVKNNKKRRSYNGFLIFFNMDPIVWYRNIHITV